MFPLTAWHVMSCIVLYQQTPVVYLQSLTLSVETSPLRCEKSVEFKCQISGATCCDTTARVWTLETVPIMSNGAASDNTKYKEEKTDGSSYFVMKMMNLKESDFNKSYKCEYAFAESNIVTLEEDDTYECIQNTSCTFESEKGPANSQKINVKGSLVIDKAAPYPLIYAFYGEDNLTSGISVVRQNYDTWYYSVYVTMKGLSCMNRYRKMFTVTSVTGTLTRKICEINLCECQLCVGICYGLSSVIHIIGSGCLVIFIVLLGLGRLVYNEGCELVKVKWITFWHFIVWFFLISCFALVVGIPICPCNESWYMLFLLMLPMLTGTASIVILHWFYKFDHTCFFVEGRKKAGYVILCIVTGGVSLIAACAMNKKWLKGTGTEKDPVKVYSKQGCKAVLEHTVKSAQEGWFKKIDNSWKEVALVGNKGYRISAKPALFNKTHYTLCVLNVQPNDAGMYRCAGDYYFELILLGGKSQSVESGSSCWPICRVGQDPNTSSSGPEKVRRSPEKERADKKKERKPTEVVRPQPSRPLPPLTQHLKTDNTGREDYSTENEMFKPRPLPNISGHSDSPRPLPKRTPDGQLEKGGIQLEPLVDSTSDRKKKKKRKKKETKQSDGDD